MELSLFYILVAFNFYYQIVSKARNFGLYCFIILVVILEVFLTPHASVNILAFEKGHKH